MTKQNSLDVMQAGWDGFKRPEAGQLFKHYKGGTYEIVATGFLEDSEAPCVIYRSKEKNIVWVRTAKNFLEPVECNGVRRPRFEAIIM